MDKISEKTIERIFLYIRTLKSLIKDGKELISSQELADILGTTDAQIRKDISNFGKVGTPGIGYNTKNLKDTLENFILRSAQVRVVLFGVGHLGTAILRYPEFHKNKIKVVAAFDKSEKKIGRDINNVNVYSINNAPSVIKRRKADIAIIAVPQESAQEVADVIAKSGIKGIVNFAPASINVPAGIFVKDIDFSVEFLSLYCYMKQ